jgi:TetR/AcrR family transcriptional repressor of nem operon
MARPRQSSATREQLLAKGVVLFATQGYNGTGLQEILAAVEVPKGSFYNYFESKEAFAAAILDHYLDELLGLFDTYVAHSKEDPATLIKNVYGYLIVDLAKRGCRQGCLLGNMAAEVGASSKLCQEALQGGFERWKSRFVPLMQRGQEEGFFRTDVDASLLADVFWNTWEGGILRMKFEGDTASLKQTIDVLVDRLLAPPKPRKAQAR